MVTVSCRLSIRMGTLIRKFYAKGVDATAMSVTNVVTKLS